MKKIRKEEMELIKIVVPYIETRAVIGGGTVLKRCAKKSNWYMVDEHVFEMYLKHSKYYLRMWDLDMNRIDGKGKKISKKEVYYLDKAIAENKAKSNRK